MNLIQNVSEPNHLMLVWQSPDLDGGPRARKRYVVADVFRDGDDAYLVYRDDEDTKDAETLGFRGYPAFNISRTRHQNVIGAFMRRMPPRDRSDYHKYLERFRISNVEMSDFALLGYTEAKLPTDGFSLVNPLNDISVPSEYLLELSGYRKYISDACEMALGDQLDLESEPTNEHDASAVKFVWKGKVVGYVNRVQAPAVSRWLTSQTLECVFERRNGTADRPRGYAFLTVL